MKVDEKLKLELELNEVPVSCFFGKTSDGRILDVKIIKLKKGVEEYIDLKDISNSNSDAALFIKEGDHEKIDLSNIHRETDLKIIEFLHLEEIYFYHSFCEDYGVNDIVDYVNKLSKFFKDEI